MPDTCQAPNCENSLQGKRKDALYCSSDCKLKAYHARNGTATKQPREITNCQREGCDNLIPEHTKVTARYCSNSCRQKVYHKNHEHEEKTKREKVRKKHQERKKQAEDKKAVDDFIQELMGE